MLEGLYMFIRDCYVGFDLGYFSSVIRVSERFYNLFLPYRLSEGSCKPSKPNVP